MDPPLKALERPPGPFVLLRESGVRCEHNRATDPG